MGRHVTFAEILQAGEEKERLKREQRETDPANLKKDLPIDQVASHIPKEVASKLASASQSDDTLASQETIKTASQNTNEVASQIKRNKASYISKPNRRGNKILQGIRLPEEIVTEIKHFCVTHKLQIQDFYELAASHYIEYVASQNEQKVASQSTEKVASKLAHDDLMIFKTHDDIIMLYRKYGDRNKWNVNDDRAAYKFNNTDRRIIEMGMIRTVINAKGKKINSFKYFMPEIEELIIAKVHPESLNELLAIGKKRLTQMRPDKAAKK